jgi:hypothetical protein
MPIRLTDNLAAPSRGTVSQALAYAVTQRADRQVFLAEYFTELYRLCQKYQLDFSILVAQSANETGKWKSAIWNQYGNPAGIGVTGTDTSSGTNYSLVYVNGKEAARAHVVHMQAYVRGQITEAAGELHDYIELDPRYDAVFQANYDGTIRRIEDFNVNGRWALLNNPPPYGTRIVNDGLAAWPGLPDQDDPPVEVPTTPEEPIPMPNVYKRVPHPPYIDLPVSKPSGGGYGYTQIPTGSRRIVGVMNHETQGRGTGPWYRDFFSCPNGDRCSDALVDYLIQRDGKIYRLNDPRNNRSPWANGGTLGLEGDGPAFYARFGATGVNNALISIEFEKTDGENYTEAQVQSGGLLNAYWHDQDEQDWDTYPYVPRYSCVTSLAHYEIGTTNCGQGELDDIGKLQAVAKGEMKKWQTQADGPSVPEAPEVPEQPEIPTLPGGLTVAEAAKRFGTLTRHAPDGSTKVMPFDPKGPISLSWLHRCVETGEWPQAQDWWALSDSGKALDIVTFSNDWQMIRTAERQAIMWARFADAELEEAA